MRVGSEFCRSKGTLYTYQYPKLGERELLVEYLPMQGPGGLDRVASLKCYLTDRKKADQALRLFRALIEQSKDAVEVVDPITLRFVDVNLGPAGI